MRTYEQFVEAISPARIAQLKAKGKGAAVDRKMAADKLKVGGPTQGPIKKSGGPAQSPIKTSALAKTTPKALPPGKGLKSGGSTQSPIKPSALAKHILKASRPGRSTQPKLGSGSNNTSTKSPSAIQKSPGGKVNDNNVKKVNVKVDPVRPGTTRTTSNNKVTPASIGKKKSSGIGKALGKGLKGLGKGAKAAGKGAARAAGAGLKGGYNLAKKGMKDDKTKDPGTASASLKGGEISSGGYSSK